MLKVVVQESKEAYGTDQLFEGMESGIKGGIYVMRLLWYKHAQEE